MGSEREQITWVCGNVQYVVLPVGLQVVSQMHFRSLDLALPVVFMYINDDN